MPVQAMNGLKTLALLSDLQVRRQVLRHVRWKELARAEGSRA